MIPPTHTQSRPRKCWKQAENLISTWDFCSFFKPHSNPLHSDFPSPSSRAHAKTPGSQSPPFYPGILRCVTWGWPPSEGMIGPSPSPKQRGLCWYHNIASNSEMGGGAFHLSATHSNSARHSAMSLWGLSPRQGPTSQQECQNNCLLGSSLS